MFTGKKGKTVTPSRRLQAKGEMCTLQTGKLCYNAININYVRNLCSYAELQESRSIFLLSWSFVKEFAVSSYRWSYAQLCMLTQDKSTKLWEPWHILRDRIGVGLVKSLNQGLWPISLHLISKRIKEILTQNANAKYLSRFNDKIAFRKYAFRRMCVHARYIPGRRNSW